MKYSQQLVKQHLVRISEHVDISFNYSGVYETRVIANPAHSIINNRDATMQNWRNKHRFDITVMSLCASLQVDQVITVN